MPEKSFMTNQELLIQISKSLSSLHDKQNQIIKKISVLEKDLIEFKNSMPTRKSGWFNDYWEMKNN